MDEKMVFENEVKQDLKAAEDNHIAKKPRTAIIQIDNYSDNNKITKLSPTILLESCPIPKIEL